MDDRLPTYVEPKPYDNKQQEAIRKLEAFVSDKEDAAAAFKEGFLDLEQEPSSIQNFWIAEQEMSPISNIIAPIIPPTYRAIYNIRTNQQEQNGRLKYIAYALLASPEIYHLGIRQNHDVEVVSLSHCCIITIG